MTSTLWLLCVLGTVLCWGAYGPSIHEGQARLGNPWKAFLCVGGAYFLLAVITPAVLLVRQGEGGFDFNLRGTAWATLAGALGAAGALFVIAALTPGAGGKPLYVMPLVFGGAPLVNVIVSLALHPPKERPHPMLYLGFLVLALGAGLVLHYKPK